MSQHQQAFFADVSDEIARVARHALALLVKGPRATSADTACERFERTAQADPDLLMRLYEAARASDRGQVPLVVQDMRAAGLSAHQITDIYLPAVACKLGAAWEEDTATFGTVTIGCARLQSVVRQLDGEDALIVSPTASAVRCLLAVPAGAQHTLGAVVLAGQMRRAGAYVQLELGVTPASMAALVRATRYDAVLISASISECLLNLRSLVASARCKYGPATIFLGGGVLSQPVDLVTATGTDYITNNWQEALARCAPVLQSV